MYFGIMISMLLKFGVSDYLFLNNILIFCESLERKDCAISISSLNSLRMNFSDENIEYYLSKLNIDFNSLIL
jgi:hypothetical protein